MSILGTSIAYIGIFVGSISGLKGRKEHTNIFGSDMVMINIKEKRDNNFNNFDNDKDYKKIKNFKLNKYHGK